MPRSIVCADQLLGPRLARGDRGHRHDRVGKERDLGVGSAEQPRAQRGETVERLAAGLGQQAAGRIDPSRVVQTGAHGVRLHWREY